MIVIRNFNENFFEHELDESDENDNSLTTDYSDWTDIIKNAKGIAKALSVVG